VRQQARQGVRLGRWEPAEETADAFAEQCFGRGEGTPTGARELEPLAASVLGADGSRHKPQADHPGDELRDGRARDSRSAGEL